VEQQPVCIPRRVVSLITLGFCALLCSCVGATRLPVRATGPAGALQPKAIDLNFVQTGSTQREEVAHQLAAVDTTYSNPRLFWARWSESRWGYWWVVGMPCNSCMAADAHRKWHFKNFLVTFDENGLATTKDTITDDKLLWRTLHSRLLQAQPPPLDLSQPIRISIAAADPDAILLSKDQIEFERLDQVGPNIQVPVRNLIRFSHTGTILGIKTTPGPTCHELEFSEKTIFGKKVKFCASPDQLGILFQYLQQTASPAMKWE